MPTPSVTISRDMLCDQAVTNRALEDGSVSSIKVSATLESENWDGTTAGDGTATQGWQIAFNTDVAEFQNVVARGTIYAEAGEISGGLVVGTLTAVSMSADNLTAGTIDASVITISNGTSITALSASSITTGTMSADHIQGGTITGTTMSADLLTAGTIDAAVITISNAASIANLNADNITTGTLAAARIATGSLDASLITSGTITTTQLSVTAGITGGQIASTTITGGNIATGTITATNIAAGTITTTELAAGTITASDIAAGTITTTQIAAGTITGGNIAAGTIAASNITSGTITATQIASGTITTTQIAAGTIVAGDIAAGTLTSASGVFGTISADDISGGTITGVTYKTAGSSQAIWIGVGGAQTIDFYNSAGTNYAEIIGDTTGQNIQIQAITGNPDIVFDAANGGTGDILFYTSGVVKIVAADLDMNGNDILNYTPSVGSHTIASHSDTTATGAELETLTGGGSTTLHSHAAPSHTIASHSDTSATGAQLNTLVGSGNTTLHYHTADRTWVGTATSNLGMGGYSITSAPSMANTGYVTINSAASFHSSNEINLSRAVYANSLASNTGTNLVITGGNQIVKDTSTRKVKKNIKPVDSDVLSLVQSLQPVTFEYRKSIGTPGRFLGLIAEDVGPAFATVDGDGEPQGLNHSALITGSIVAIQDLYARLETLERKVA